MELQRESLRVDVCGFLRGRTDEIVAMWTERVGELSPAKDLPRLAIVDHLPEILARLAAAVSSGQSGFLAEVPRAHTAERLARGFDLGEVVREYVILRGCILELWESQMRRPMDNQEASRLHRGIDEAIEEAIAQFSVGRERELRALGDQTALRAAEARLRLATEATRIGTWDLNLITGEAQWSPEMRRIFGADFQPPAGWSLEMIHPDDRAAVEAMLARSYDPRGDGEFASEYRIVKGGESRWVASRGRTLFDEKGRPARMVGTTFDITTRKRAEIASKFLSDATAVLASSLDYRKTLDEVCRLVVQRFADWAVASLVERDGTLTEVTVAHADPSKEEQLRRLLEQYPRDAHSDAGAAAVVRSGRPELVREIGEDLLKRIAPDERQRQRVRELGFRSYLIVPMVARGRALGAITLASAETGRRLDDIDLKTASHLGHRVALAIDNARLYEDACEATRLREQVLAIVSHDLRNPLNAIRLAANLLSVGLPEASSRAVHRQVSAIGRSADRMEHLIGDLLDVANIQAGRLSMEPRGIDVGQLLEDAVATHEGAAAQKGVRLRREGPPPNVRVTADPDRLLQVLANLIGNAIKFCHPGDDVVVRAGLDAHRVVFSVRDTGPGIPAEELGHVFDPYWSSSRHANKGTGLGLYISRAIVDAHRGRIWAESTVGIGSTFYFTIPIAS